jgi:hypothetical protein
LYIHIEQAYYSNDNDQHIYKVAKNIEEALPLLEEGFTEAHDFDGVKIYRKPKSALVVQKS